MELIKKIKKDIIDRAIETIKGYCTKHPYCGERCRFFDREEYKCMFEKGIIPCDWSDNDA